MKDFIEVNNKRVHYMLVQKDIRFKGKAYISVRKVRGGSAAEAADTGAAHLQKNGAREIYFTCRDSAVTLPDVVTTPGGRTFRHVYDMDWLGKDVADFKVEETGLSLWPVDEKNHGQFQRIYNDCFYGVPNGATYTRTDVRKLMAPEREGAAGLLLADGEAIGIYELTFGETSEIDAVGITAAKRGAGYGRQALALLLGELRSRGAHSVRLLVCTANETAYGLYIKNGFEKKSTQSRWYRMD